MPTDILMLCEEEMKDGIANLESELSKLRTGRANPGVLDRVMVKYYGAPTPLIQLAIVSVPTATQLMVKPFDKGSLKDIEAGINEANLNLVPNNDGECIRINFPAITEDSRKSLVKDVKRIGEQSKVTIRNVRKNAMDSLKKLELREDELKGYQDDIQKITDKYNKQIEDIVSKKEVDVMKV